MADKVDARVTAAPVEAAELLRDTHSLPARATAAVPDMPPSLPGRATPRAVADEPRPATGR